jgi:hypothetical protein
MIEPSLDHPGVVVAVAPLGGSAGGCTTYDQAPPRSASCASMRLKIVEKDIETGYVLFELAEDGKIFRGALELVRIQDDSGRAAVRLIISVADRPTYTETGLLQRLVHKLRKELPESPAPAPKPEA